MNRRLIPPMLLVTGVLALLMVLRRQHRVEVTVLDRARRNGAL